MRYLAIFLAGFFLFLACDREYSPAPRGFFRIDYPEKQYETWSGDCPFTYEYPEYAGVYPDTTGETEPCWQNIYFPDFDAYIHLSYKPVTEFQGINELREDARTFAYEHTVRASDIDKSSRKLDEQSMGTIYEIDGEAASAVQFYVTDTNHHYMRGALYFDAPMQRDSLNPLIDFLQEDVEHFMETLEWEY